METAVVSDKTIHIFCTENRYLGHRIEQSQWSKSEDLNL